MSTISATLEQELWANMKSEKDGRSGGRYLPADHLHAVHGEGQAGPVVLQAGR